MSIVLILKINLERHSLVTKYFYTVVLVLLCTSSTTVNSVINLNPNSDFSPGIKHPLTGNRWHTWR